MVGSLQRVLVCSPRTAGWGTERASCWHELGFRHAPQFELAQAQHETLRDELMKSGVEVLQMQACDGISIDAVYTHDASLLTDYGVILMRPGKSNRVDEAEAHREFCRSLDIPVLGSIALPATSEAGDMVWLDPKTLLIGQGYRTNAAGISQMRHLLAPKSVDVLAAPLPYGPGPSACLHLMSLMSLLDEATVLVDLPWLAVDTVELLKSRCPQLVEIDASERDTLACNVLSLGGKRLLALAENPRTNERLQRAGFEVRTFFGSELCINGSGGPTCLTRPLLRG
jgi:dimethylargininase